MNIFNHVFSGKVDFVPDYRDTILYNGHIEFRATGKFDGDLMEFLETKNSSNKILFNTNLTKQQYIELHSKYDLVRIKDEKDFSASEILMQQGTFLPTGRIFYNDAGLNVVWEYMQKNNPQTVVYMQLSLNDNYITGKKCLGTNVIDTAKKQELVTNPKINLTNIKFTSSDHIRYENGIDKYGHQKGANRGIEIVGDDQFKDAFNVTIFNLNGNHPVWGTNIQMHPKRMKIISQSESIIELLGFGNDASGASFSNYGITLFLKNSEVERIILHMIDRKVDIEYFK